MILVIELVVLIKRSADDSQANPISQIKIKFFKFVVYYYCVVSLLAKIAFCMSAITKKKGLNTLTVSDTNSGDMTVGEVFKAFAHWTSWILAILIRDILSTENIFEIVQEIDSEQKIL